VVRAAARSEEASVPAAALFAQPAVAVAPADALCSLAAAVWPQAGAGGPPFGCSIRPAGAAPAPGGPRALARAALLLRAAPPAWCGLAADARPAVARPHPAGPVLFRTAVHARAVCSAAPLHSARAVAGPVLGRWVSPLEALLLAAAWASAR